MQISVPIPAVHGDTDPFAIVGGAWSQALFERSSKVVADVFTSKFALQNMLLLVIVGSVVLPEIERPDEVL